MTKFLTLDGIKKENGDVFKAWNNNPMDFIICFGTKGDEFEG